MRELLLRGAERMGIVMPADAPDKLIAYHALLTEANKTMNLTRVSDDPAEAVDRNYLDSVAPLAVPGLLSGVRTLCDVGSGAGFPGIPLAIVCPHIRVTLMDSLGKRVGFLKSVIDALSLNAEAVHTRAEDAARLPAFRDRFDLVTARAVASLPVLIELALPFARVGGRMLAYKGPSLPEELAQSQAALRRLAGSHEADYDVRIPGRDWDHQLCVILKKGATPKAFPRKAGEAGRNPILV